MRATHIMYITLYITLQSNNSNDDSNAHPLSDWEKTIDKHTI